MPKDLIDYSNTIIYKICCKDKSITDLYVGHTTNFAKRKYQHKNLCSSNKKLKIYKVIQENGGWDNWDIIEVAKYNCKDSIEAKTREQEHYNKMKHDVNNELENTQFISQSGMTKEDKGGQKVAKKYDNFYSCVFCHYNTSKKNNYEKHILTLKHKRMTNDYAVLLKNSKSSQEIFICNCGKEYKHRQGLWKHKKICLTQNFHEETTSTQLINKDNTINDKDLIMMLIKDNNELKKIMMEQQSLMLENNNKVLEICKNGTHNTTNTHTNSHNKAFNLNFFLNETCKNAMNIMDFAESIQLQLSDLEAIGKAGFVEGISNIIVKKLKALDVTERPIHCADKKREVIYIKDEGEWEKEDEEKKKLKNVINNVAYKNQRLLPKYKEAHPGCNYSDSKFSDQYSKLVIEAMGGAGNNETEKTDKIIKNITKEIVIDKYTIS